MYAVAPHLISLAALVANDTALDLLIFAGWIYADSSRPGAGPCPALLLEEFNTCAPQGGRTAGPSAVGHRALEIFRISHRCSRWLPWTSWFWTIHAGVDTFRWLSPSSMHSTSDPGQLMNPASISHQGANHGRLITARAPTFLS